MFATKFIGEMRSLLNQSKYAGTFQKLVEIIKKSMSYSVEKSRLKNKTDRCLFTKNVVNQQIMDMEE